MLGPRTDGITERDPALMHHPVHDEGMARMAEQKALVAEQGEARARIRILLDDAADLLDARRMRQVGDRIGPQQIRQRYRAGKDNRHR